MYSGQSIVNTDVRNIRPSCVHKRNYGTLHPFKLFVGQRPAQMDNNNIFVRVGRSVRLTESRHYFPFIASITCANRLSGTLAKVMPGLVSVSILPVNSWMCLLDHSPGARLHNAKIIAVGFGAAFLWTIFFLTSTILPFLSNADSVVVSSHS